MCMARFLLALACIFSSAAPASASESALEMELSLALSPSLYLRLDVGRRVVEVKVRGMVLDTHEVRAVKFVYTNLAGAEESEALPGLPLVVKSEGVREVEWRQIVAPPTLVPYSESAEPPAAKLTAAVIRPDQYEVDLDSGWRLVVGPESPYGPGSRLGRRLVSGWKRLIGRHGEPPQPSLVVEMSSEDSRELVHLFADGIPIVITCNTPEEAVPAVAAVAD
jgi:hypothetical protein